MINQSAIGRKILISCAILASLTISAARAETQQIDPDQRELVRVQIARERLQMDYLRSATELNKHNMMKSPIDDSHKPKTLWGKIDKDPVDTLDASSAIFAILISFLVLISNARATRQDARNMRFYEALKRFGDKESPSLRCSAAGLIAQMGQERSFKWCWTKPWNSWNHRLYLETAISQLDAGRQLEENTVVKQAIERALGQLTRDNQASQV